MQLIAGRYNVGTKSSFVSKLADLSFCEMIVSNASISVRSQDNSHYGNRTHAAAIVKPARLQQAFAIAAQQLQLLNLQLSCPRAQIEDGRLVFLRQNYLCP